MRDYPVLPFLLAAALVPVVGRRVGGWLVLGAPVVALAQVAAAGTGRSLTVEYYGYQLTPMRLDELSLPFVVVFVVAAFLAGLFGWTTLGTRERVTALITAGAAVGVVLAGDLLTLFVMWELKAVATTVLITASGAAGAASAGRYLMAHLVGGSLLLGGVLWHLAAVGSLDFGDLTGSPGAALVLLAVLLAAAAPPLHAWLPDAYPSASVTGTVVLAAFTTKAAVYALVRGFSGLDVLVPVGVVMALYGVVYAVLEDDLRRLLSYHIVSQVGFMVAAVGVAGPAAANGATAHAVAHILYKGLLLMGAGAVIMATGRSRLSELGGLGRRMPLVFTCTVIGALSISGLPLFSGFVSKELAVDAVRGTDLGWAVQALKVASVGTFLSVGLKLVWFSFGGPDRGLRPTRLPASVLVALVVGAALNVLIGLRPGLLYDLLPHAVAFQPFVAKQVADTLQLLGLTALVFVWLRDRVRPSPGLSLDVDWVVRGLPLLVRSRLAAARPAGGWSAPVQAVRDRTRRLADTAAAAVIDRVPAATPSTTALGGVLLAALGVVLVRSVLP